MKCIRGQTSDEGSSTELCQRCKRNNRECKIPEPKKLGRRHGAVGRYHGVEKAYRKMKAELKKTSTRANGKLNQMANVDMGEEPILELLLSNDPVETAESSLTPPQQGIEDSDIQYFDPNSPSPQQSQHLRNVISQSTHEPVSNPLALLADASGAVQALEPSRVYNNPIPTPGEISSAEHRLVSSGNGRAVGRQLLHRPGYVSLGLSLSRETLEAGIDALSNSSENLQDHSNYFTTPQQIPLGDVGSEFDPVDLGLVTMDEACYLFPM